MIFAFLLLEVFVNARPIKSLTLIKFLYRVLLVMGIYSTTIVNSTVLFHWQFLIYEVYLFEKYIDSVYVIVPSIYVIMLTYHTNLAWWKMLGALF